MKITEKVLKWKLGQLYEEIKKLNKKAKKMGIREMTLELGEETTHKIKDPISGRTVGIIVYVEATIDYEIPIIDGWELISTFDIFQAKDKSVVMTSTVPGKELPKEYLNKTEIHCDHCGHNRFRTHSMLMRHIETGEYKEVGSSCVKDFFGHDPKHLLWIASFDFRKMLSSLEDDDFRLGSGSQSYDPLEMVLIYSSAVIRKHGWCSKGAAYEDPSLVSTFGYVLQYIANAFNPSASKEDRITIDNEDNETAESTIEYFKNINAEDNDYLSNCQKLCELGYVPFKMYGVACSMVSSYKRFLNENAAKKERKKSNWIGEIKERLELTVKCFYKMHIESYYGMSTLYMFCDSDGNVFKTFYSESQNIYRVDIP